MSKSQERRISAMGGNPVTKTFGFWAKAKHNDLGYKPDFTKEFSGGSDQDVFDQAWNHCTSLGADYVFDHA